MRFRLAVLLATMSFYGAAQRGGGMPTGHGGGGGRWGSPSPTPPRFGIGRHPWWRGGRGGFGTPFTFGSFPSWFDTPFCASPLFPLAPDCSFGQGFDPANYSQPPIYVSPTVNVVAPPPPPGPPLVPIASAPNEAASPAKTNAGELSKADSSAYHQEPARGPATQCPTLIVLKTGGMYSITRYWIKGKTLYFETTAHDTLYAPRSLLEQIIPGR